MLVRHHAEKPDRAKRDHEKSSPPSPRCPPADFPGSSVHLYNPHGANKERVRRVLNKRSPQTELKKLPQEMKKNMHFPPGSCKKGVFEPIFSFFGQVRKEFSAHPIVHCQRLSSSGSALLANLVAMRATGAFVLIVQNMMVNGRPAAFHSLTHSLLPGVNFHLEQFFGAGGLQRWCFFRHGLNKGTAFLFGGGL